VSSTDIVTAARTGNAPKAWKRFRRNGPALIALAIVAAFGAVALLAPYLAQHSPRAISYTAILKPPSALHWFGTDELGRDVFARVVFGARVSLGIGFSAVLIASIVGTIVGIASGYLGGWVDEIVMRVVDALMALPFLVLAIVIAAVLGANMQNTILAVAIVSIPAFARLARGETIALKDREFIQAVNALGARSVRIVLRHVLPNVSGPLIVQTTLATAQAILTESSLSFLGLGVQPPTPAWGSMLNTAKGYLETAPWMALFPGSAIFLVVLALSLLGDGLREAFNPRGKT
jgi:peptide/nickel transport system permease protein